MPEFNVDGFHSPEVFQKAVEEKIALGVDLNVTVSALSGAGFTCEPPKLVNAQDFAKKRAAQLWEYEQPLSDKPNPIYPIRFDTRSSGGKYKDRYYYLYQNNFPKSDFYLTECVKRKNANLTTETWQVWLIHTPDVLNGGMKITDRFASYDAWV